VRRGEHASPPDSHNPLGSLRQSLDAVRWLNFPSSFNPCRPPTQGRQSSWVGGRGRISRDFSPPTTPWLKPESDSLAVACRAAGGRGEVGSFTRNPSLPAQPSSERSLGWAGGGRRIYRDGPSSPPMQGSRSDDGGLPRSVPSAVLNHARTDVLNDAAENTAGQVTAYPGHRTGLPTRALKDKH
jgi:hypothetical protein